MIDYAVGAAGGFSISFFFFFGQSELIHKSHARLSFIFT